MDRPMRILYVHRSAGKAYGGALVDLLRVLERLDRKSFEPIVLLSHGDFHAGLFQKIGIRTIHLPLPPWRKGKSLPKIPFAIYCLVSLLKSEGIDLVHLNDADDIATVGLACRWVRMPCVVHVRSEMEPKKFRKLWVHRADCVLAVSEAGRQAAIAGGVKEGRIRISYSGVDLGKIEKDALFFSAREKLGIPPGALVIGSVANIAPKKGYHYLIEAFSKVAHNAPLFLIIVGADDHGMQKELVAKAATSGVADRIHFVGFQDNVYPFIAAMDIFALASVNEGFGIVLLEAMALGKPVIATEVHGPPEIILHGETGFLVPPADADALGKVILLFIQNPSLQKIMGEAGRERVIKKFSLGSQICMWESVYIQLLQPRGKQLSSLPRPKASIGVHEKAIEIFLTRSGFDHKILDLPCGEGAMALSLVERGYQPFCADIEPAHFKVPGLSCEKVDLNKGLPFPDNSFDAWICIEGIEHIENPHHLIREASRILRPGGRLIVSTPNTLSVKSRYYTLRFGYPVHFDLMVKREQEIEGRFTVQHLNPISFIELRYLLEENGFAIKHIGANRMESRHHIRHAIISWLFIRKRPLKNDSLQEVEFRRLLATKNILYGEILLVEAIKE